MPRSREATIGGSVHRTTAARRMQNCAPVTDIWLENCGRATNETEPARIVAASLNPKVLKAADERKGEDPPDFEYIAPRCKA